MGDALSSSHEWLELYNPSTSSINLAGWVLQTADQGIRAVLRGDMPSQGFFILERSDDNVLPNIKADIIYQGALSNQGEKLQLLNNQNQIVDEIDFSKGWPAGDNKTKQTLQRIQDSSGLAVWCASQTAGGTPKQANACPTALPISLEPSQPATTSLPITAKPALDSIQAKNILINEFIPAPQGPDAENEWIELYNANNFEADITSWQIKDIAGAVKKYTFPKDTLIPEQGFLILTRPQSNIALQNDQDGLELLNSQGVIVDTIKYQQPPTGQSYNRTAEGWQWSLALTPGKPNIIKTNQPQVPASATSTQATASPTTTANVAQASTNIANTSKPPANRVISLLIGLILAAVSAIIILTLYKKSPSNP